MASDWSRRQLLHAAGTAVCSTVLSGCLFGLDSEPPAGSLVISNERADEHTVTVTATRTSEDSDEIGDADQTPSPKTTSLWEHEEQFTIAAGEEVRQRGFITEPGAYYLVVRLANGERASHWIGFYGAAGGGVAEDVLYVEILDQNRLFIAPSHGD